MCSSVSGNILDLRRAETRRPGDSWVPAPSEGMARTWSSIKRQIDVLFTAFRDVPLSFKRASGILSKGELMFFLLFNIQCYQPPVTRMTVQDLGKIHPSGGVIRITFRHRRYVYGSIKDLVIKQAVVKWYVYVRVSGVGYSKLDVKTEPTTQTTRLVGRRSFSTSCTARLRSAAGTGAAATQSPTTQARSPTFALPWLLRVIAAR